MHRFLLALTLVGACWSVRAEDPAPTPTAEETAAMSAAEVRGEALWRHDQAASVATDVAVASRAFRKDKRVAGWITQETASGIVVTFVDATPAALYRIPVSKDGKAGALDTLPAPAALTPYEAGAAQARALALAAKFDACSDTYNSVVLPTDASNTRWTVYLLPGTKKARVVPIGGSHRFDIADGKIAWQRAYTRTCIALETDPRSVAMFITHLLDPMPTEVHVFWQRYAHQAMYVGTETGMWSIENGHVALVERRDERDAQDSAGTPR